MASTGPKIFWSSTGTRYVEFFFSNLTIILQLYDYLKIEEYLKPYDNSDPTIIWHYRVYTQNSTFYCILSDNFGLVRLKTMKKQNYCLFLEKNISNIKPPPERFYCFLYDTFSKIRKYFLKWRLRRWILGTSCPKPCPSNAKILGG